MTTSRPVSVESPHHVHPTRMRHISRADLMAGLGHPGASIPALRREVAFRTARLRPVWDPAVEARAVEGTPEGLRVLTAADELLTRDVEFVSPSVGRSGLYGLHYLTWLTPLITAYELTGNEDYPACFGRIFDEWYCSRDHVVGDWPGLDAVWYSLGVWARATVIVPALTSFALSAELADDTVASAFATLLGGARWAAEEHDAFRPGNWQLVCAGELLHVAAFLPLAKEGEQWASTGRARLLEHLDRDFYADGGHHERSPGYHAMCLEALQRAAVVTGGDRGFRLNDHPRFTAAHRWLASMTTPDGWVPPWQDSTTVRPAELLARGRRLLLSPRTEASGSPDDRSTHLPTSGYVVMRGPAPSDGYLGVNVGPYVEHELESHSHLAVTDFVLSAWNAPLALEAGGPRTYDDPAYQQWYRTPAAHNMVTVDGVEIATDRRAHVDHADLTGRVQVVYMHHDGYPYRVSRRILFVGIEPIYWLISDTVAEQPDATWSILGPTPWEPAGRGYRSVGAPSLTVIPVDRPDSVSHSTGPGQVPGRESTQYQDLHALRMHSSSGTFDVLLVPSRARSAPRWQIEATAAGWQIANETFVDVVSDGVWERRSMAGELVDSAQWTAPHPPSLGADR